MQIIVLSNEVLKEELTATGTPTYAEVVWVSAITDFDNYPQADAYIDLLFNNDKSRKNVLSKLSPKPVIINSVNNTLKETHTAFVRINAWPTFLQSAILEGSCINENVRPITEAVFKLFNKQLVWLPDEAGFITPRVISMIINEAYFALAEGVSTKEEMDTAMQLGTNYPYGPFAWSEKIGLKNMVALLNKLSIRQKRYTPCELLVQEAEKR